MRIVKSTGILALIAMTLVMPGAVRADGSGAKVTGKLAAMWTLPKQDGSVMLLMAGQADPVATSVSDTTVFGAVCLDCGLPMEFKAADAGKSCAVCGCSVSNAQCVVGKPVKGNTWQTMLATLPRGVAVWVTFNDPDKPQAGAKKLVVDLRQVLLPVTGLDGQTPDQLLALVKPLGGSKAELIDSGKRLSITLKSDWTAEREAKLEKALAGLNAKIVAPDEPKSAP